MKRFDDASPKSIPLYHRSADNGLVPVTLADEKEISVAGSNTIALTHWVDSEGVDRTATGKWREIANPFNNMGDKVFSITHATNPVTKTTTWFAVVRPALGTSDELWRSTDKVDWVKCSIAGAPTSFRLTAVRSSALSESDGYRVNGVPVVAAVGSNGTTPIVLKTVDLVSFTVCTLPVVSASPNDIVWGGGEWMVVSSDPAVILKNSTLDLLDGNWTEIVTTEELGSVAFGDGVWVASNYAGGYNETLRFGMKYSIDAGLNWTSINTPTNINTMGIRKVRYTGEKWAAVGHVFNLLGNGKWGSGAWFSDDGITWTNAVVVNNDFGTKFTDIDWGYDRWMISVSDPTSDYWYSFDPDGVRLYNAQFLSTIAYHGMSIQYGGGSTKSWLMASELQAALIGISGEPKYHQSISRDSIGNNYIGSYFDTYYDSGGVLRSDETKLYQYRDSEISYNYFFGAGDSNQNNEPIYVGADSSGDIWEFDSDTALELGTRLATYHYLYQNPGSFRLELNDDVDSDEWHFWLKDIIVDRKDSDVFDRYSIIRKSAQDVESSIDLDGLLKLVGPQDQLPNVDLNPSNELGLQELGTQQSNVARKLMAFAKHETGIGDMLLIEDPTTPLDAPYNETGGWLKRGSANDDRETSAGSGSYYTENTYTLWVRVTADSIGNISYVDSDYFTPEGKDSGYVYP